MDHGPYDEVGDAQEYLTAFASGAVWSDEALKLCDRSMLVVDALRYHRDVTDQAGLLRSPVAQRVDWQYPLYRRLWVRSGRSPNMAEWSRTPTRIPRERVWPLHRPIRRPSW